jgi:hypothetical protein
VVATGAVDFLGHGAAPATSMLLVPIARDAGWLKPCRDGGGSRLATASAPECEQKLQCAQFGNPVAGNGKPADPLRRRTAMARKKIDWYYHRNG